MVFAKISSTHEGGASADKVIEALKNIKQHNCLAGARQGLREVKLDNSEGKIVLVNGPGRAEFAHYVFSGQHILVLVHQGKPEVPAGSDVDIIFSASPPVSHGILYRTQCTQVIFGAAGSGASGSSTIKTRLWASAGTPDH